MKRKIKIMLGDLTHTGENLNSDHFPLRKTKENPPQADSLEFRKFHFEEHKWKSAGGGFL